MAEDVNGAVRKSERRLVVGISGASGVTYGIRTLDALHVASALNARAAVPDLAILSLDHKIRAVSQELGFTVLP